MKYIVTIVFSFFVLLSNAQNKFFEKINYGAGLNGGIPVGIFSSVYNFTYGGNLKAEYPVSERFTLTFNTGYTEFLRKKGGIGVSFVPVLGGFKYFIDPKLFLSAQGGIAIPIFESDLLYGVVPGIGYKLSEQFAITANYNGYAQYGLIIGSAGFELVYYFNTRPDY